MSVMGLGRDFATLPDPGCPRDQGLNDSSQSGLVQRKGCVSEINSRLFERPIPPMRRPGPQGPRVLSRACLGSAAILGNSPFGLHGCGVGTQCTPCGPLLACLGRSARPRSSRRRLWCAESLDPQPSDAAIPEALRVSLRHPLSPGQSCVLRPQRSVQLPPNASTKPTATSTEPRCGSFPASGGIGGERGRNWGGSPCSGTRKGNFLTQATCRVLSFRRQGFSWHGELDCSSLDSRVGSPGQDSLRLGLPNHNAVKDARRWVLDAGCSRPSSLARPSPWWAAQSKRQPLSDQP